MLLRICAIYDKAAAIFSSPMFVRHVAEARRSVEQAARDGKTMLSQYPEQFSLWSIGLFDDTTGEIKPEPHIIICQIAELNTPPE